MIGPHAGQHDVVAGTGDDDVAPGRLIERVGGLCALHLGRIGPEIELRIVAGDDVVAGAADDPVRPGAADQDVVAFETIERVVAANERINAEHLVRQPCQAVAAIARATTTGLLDDLRGRHSCHDFESHHAAAVAEQDVVARATGDDVIALAAEYHQRQGRRERDAGLRINAGTDHDVVIRQVRVVVPGTLGIENERAVAGVQAIRFGDLQIHVHRIVAKPGIERGDVAHTRTIEGSVDAHDVVAEAGPEGDAIGKTAGSVGAIGDGAARQIDPAERILAAGQAAHRNLGVGRLRPCDPVSDHDAAVA